jgi:amino acid transporter
MDKIHTLFWINHKYIYIYICLRCIPASYAPLTLLLFSCACLQAYKGIAHPISYAAEQHGQQWLALAIDVGALAGTSSVVLVSLLSQPRICRRTCIRHIE